MWKSQWNCRNLLIFKLNYNKDVNCENCKSEGKFKNSVIKLDLNVFYGSMNARGLRERRSTHQS